MSDTATEQPRAPGQGLMKALKKVLVSLEPPRVAIVALTQGRCDFIRGLCLRVESESAVHTLLKGAAPEPLSKGGYHLVLLDCSLTKEDRLRFKETARQASPSVNVIEIKKWSSEPPS